MFCMGRAGGALLIDLGYSMVFAVTGYYRDSFSTNLLLRDKHLQEREAAWCVPAAVYLVSTEPFFPFLPSWPGLLKPPPGIRHRSIPGRPKDSIVSGSWPRQRSAASGKQRNCCLSRCFGGLRANDSHS